MSSAVGFARGRGYQANIRPGFIGDFLNREHVLPGGIKVDPTSFINADDVPVVLNGESVQGATSMAIDALLGQIPAHTLLNFGARTQETVTVGTAGAAEGATTIPVDALTVEMPSGQILDFGSRSSVTATATATAAKAATSIAVTALTLAIPNGAVLDFGSRAAVSVVVGAAGAAPGDTTVPVAALSGPIPNGTVLNFGGAKFATLNAAAATGATSLTVLALPTAVVSADTATYAAVAHVMAVLSAGAAAGATSLTVVALAEEVLSGKVATFAAIAHRTAVLTADAAIGATSLTVAALTEPLDNTDTATYMAETALTAMTTADAAIGATTIAVAALDNDIADGLVAYFQPVNQINWFKDGQTLRVPAGTPVYISAAALEAGAASGVEWLYAGPGTVLSGDEIVAILCYDTYDANLNNDADVLRAGSLIKSNFLYWSALDSTVKSKIRSRYEVTVGSPGQEVAA